LILKHYDRLEKIIKDASEGNTIIINKPINPIRNLSRSTDKSKNIGP
jgi:hypothetical protein